jgi:pimeloyl-ACP methyl ester carboxylesterase
MNTIAVTTLPADAPLRCFGFADAAAPVLKQIAEGRPLVSGHDGGQAAASALIAKGEACAEALYFAAEHGDIVESVVLISPDASAVQRAAEIGGGCKAHVLALAGTLDADGGSAATALKKTLPACHLVYVFDAGQDMDTKRPEALTKVARDFLARRDKFLVSNADGRLTP